MCGIVGILRFDGSAIGEQELKAFNDSLAHRGPDGEGLYIDQENHIGLGHVRLSILDLSDAGRQPMYNQDNSLMITFNGEVYNYLELRSELKHKGYQFQTRTDTEVILAAYTEWGDDCIKRFNGMWAFAIWDKRRKQLFVSRDRFGVKPLYYAYKKGQYFVFASESIAFKHLSFFKKEFDADNLTKGIANVFYLEGVGETIYKGIHKLKPGHNIRIGPQKKISIHKWWETSENLVEVPMRYDDQVEEFRRILIDACKLRLRSDVPIGIALSGGLDSSSIFGVIKHIEKTDRSGLQNLPSDWQKAFVASFPGTSIDEKNYADEVIRYTGGIASYIYPKEDQIVSQIVNQVRSEDFIYLSPPIVHTIYQEMKSLGVVVSMDGHGVDEMLYGYPNMILEWAQDEQDSMLSHSLMKTWSDITLKEIENGGKVLTQNNGSGNNSMYRRLYDNLIPDSLKLTYRKWSYQKQIESKYLKRYSNSELTCKEWAQDKLHYRIPYRKFHLDSIPTLLRNWDSASMQHGVEIRMPFMDYRLVSYVFSLPGNAKVRNYFSKSILRDAMKGFIPEGIRTRKDKIGINAPTAEWFNHPMNAFLMDAVHSRSFMKSDIWNGQLLCKEIEDLCHKKTWTLDTSNIYWPYINAWILMHP